MASDSIDSDVLKELLEIARRLGDLESSHKEHTVRQEMMAEVIARHMRKEEENQKELAVQLAEFNERMRAVPTETHAKHHMLFDQMLEERKNKALFWGDMRSKLATGGVWAVIVTLCTIAWYAANQYFVTKGG